ncbi:cytochrome C, partial [bacterium]
LHLPAAPHRHADQDPTLQALGVLDPATRTPPPVLDAVKAVDLARLTKEAFDAPRNKMIGICSKCHSTEYVKEQLKMGDDIMMKADRMMGEAIQIVADLYKDGIIKKPADYPHNYPNFLFFMRTGGKDLLNYSYIDQVLFQMYMRDRMRAYQGFFHVNPDYAYWYGWAMMSKDLGEIKELAATMRATHKK